MGDANGGGTAPLGGNGNGNGATIGGTAPAGSVIITGLTHEQQLAHQAANAALSGTSTPTPTFTASQQVVAATTHTSSTPVHVQTAQQKAVNVTLGTKPVPGKTKGGLSGFHLV